MFTRKILAAVVFASAAPALGQVAGINQLHDTPSPSKGEPPAIELELEFAPVIAGEEPFTLGDSVSDYSSTTATVATALPVGEGMKLGLSGGLSVATDLDEDSDDEGGSSFFGTAKFSWDRGFRTFNPFVSYGFERAFDARLPDLIAANDYLDHKIKGGVAFQTNSWTRCKERETRETGCSDETAAVKLEASLERRYSDVATRERLTPELKLEATGKFLAGIAWTGFLSGQIRRFDEIAGDRRIDYRGVVFGGFDLADAIGRKFVKEFKIGAQWVKVESNTAGKDVSEWNVLPVLKLGTAF